ncbi:SDR family NAD(P)-dependent oxidoreductase [Variovorax sp. 278MFTsu5.1]|uniref:SDR family NAD(P)-dependent oxidoreductase n=1 Tax=Variovorax sp. 278MFTsu5.1 TaxID=3158366 RepID=UPI003AABBE1B
MRCLVTGAARGIGRAIAQRLAHDAVAHGGAQLALIDQHHGELDMLADELHTLGSRALVLTGDLCDPALTPRLVAAALEAFGGLDAVVSNAGCAIPGELATYELASWDRVFAVNVRAPWLLAKAAHAALKDSRGAFLLTASISGTHATSPLGAYSPSKAAALMLVKQLANEWGTDGIRVNAISPGLTLTPGTAAAYASPAARRQREQRVPLRRLAEAQDMAGAAAFLLGRDAAYITGAELVIDGGLGNTLMGSLQMSGWQAAGAR